MPPGCIVDLVMPPDCVVDLVISPSCVVSLVVFVPVWLPFLVTSFQSSRLEVSVGSPICSVSLVVSPSCVVNLVMSPSCVVDLVLFMTV